MSPTGPVPRWQRYVALGDSFSEGLWDLAPTAEDPAPRPPAAGEPLPGTGSCRGWADLLAGALSQRRTAAGLEPLLYANLAVRGRLLGRILDEQVPAALELGADLVSLVGGGNDILRPGADVGALARGLEDAVVRLRAAGADVLLGTGVDTRESPLVRATRGRVAIYSTTIWSIARRHGAHVVDLWGMRSLADWRMWADDRIHLTTDGHVRVAQAALVGLGLDPDRADWDDPLAPLPPAPRLERVRADARWVRAHVYPWATRRLRGRSSGDVVSAKRPVLEPLVVDGAPLGR
ncbi:SGNH/GDSL hydrolase family protein [Cellulomonas marina]|uniref:Lysophospholipase L1 n=1 Tax=Cellulomonas marina TaxID=988821 RepID=A0A1I0WJM7_9CELL|nr:SGNH/GDSL hydrolase family protein [Cellulomonas marina]GIG27703.1 SGNH hydrolase [Cellulomonas marina]SFA88952.1 Lysophospholipase L1 [Cellulomonas marina]